MKVVVLRFVFRVFGGCLEGLLLPNEIEVGEAWFLVYESLNSTELIILSW
jgi:hypothetical protein